MLDIVTLGEPMIQLNALTTGPLRHVNYFERHVAGAEANVAVTAARIGLKAGLISKVGGDEFGTCILNTLRGEGVDISRLEVDREGFTGVYFIQRGYPVPGKSRVFYYRKGSAASSLGPKDMDKDYIESAKILYLTGITPALSGSCLRACTKATEMAKRAGLKIAFDTNIRPKLWLSQDPREALLPLLRSADIVFTDAADSRLLMGESNGPKVARKMMAMGASIVVIKGGAGDTLAYSGTKVYRQKAFDVPVVDPVGAGDAFGGVFIAGYLKGWGIEKSLAAGGAAGSLVVMARGDEENIPTESDISDFLEFQLHK
jgi:2-dehydro-3-deoxygluconokinase / 2-dehydro-3-deoxygalactonokinase